MNYIFGGNVQKRSDIVTQTIDKYQFPTREQLERQMGYSDDFLFKTFWFMYASSFGLKNHLGKHSPVHDNDVATNTVYREDESGFRLKQKGMVPAFLHDLFENLAEELTFDDKILYLPAGLLVADTAHSSLAKDSGVDVGHYMRLLGNKGELIFDPIKDYFESKAIPGVKLDVSVDDIVAKIDSTYKDFSVDHTTIKKLYGRLVKRWEHVKNQVEGQRHNYLNEDEISYITKTISGFMKDAQDQSDNRKKDKLDLEKAVKLESQRVKELLGDRNPVPIPEDFRLNLESEILVSAKQTIYSRLYLSDIMDAVVEYAAALDENPGITKNLDARDNSSRIGPKLENMRGQFMKYTALLEKDGETIKVLKAKKLPFEVFELSMKFLYRTLKDTVNERKGNYLGWSRGQTQYNPERDMLTFMSTLIPAVGRRIGAERDNVFSKIASVPRSLFNL